MGLLDILNGMQNGPRGASKPGEGGMSPITMALIGLLAYKAFKHLTNSQPGAAPAQIPGGTRASLPDNAADGGLGNLGGLGDLLRNGLGAPNTAGGSTAGSGGGLGGLLQGGLGGLGGLLAGGAAGTVLGSGLNDLLKQLQQAGHSETASSWVGTGPNRNIAPDDLGQALGEDAIQSLAQQSGLSRDELLTGLSQQLPELIDKLTPDGRMPTENELSRLL
ncbi:MAG: YidB family protein [Pseudorhodoplanes sp.]